MLFRMAIAVPLKSANTHTMNEISFQTIEAEKANLSDLLFKASSDGILILNEENEIIKVNPNVLSLFSYTESELLHQPFELLFAGKKKEALLPLPEDFFFNTDASEGNRTQIVLAKKKNGDDIVIELTSLFFEEEGKKRILVLFSDHQKYSMNELIKRFASMASHEMKTPLTSILSSTFLLEKYITAQSEFEKQRKHVEMIKLSAQQLNSIINDFLSHVKEDDHRIKQD